MSKIKGYEPQGGDLQKSVENKKAIALLYNDSNAPVVSAKGEGGLADQIVKLANEHGVYVAEDPILADILSRLEVDQEIPEELYQSVAVILSWAYWLKGRSPA